MGVSDEDMANLVSYFHPTSLEKGDYFLRAGRVCDKLSFHRSGLLRAYAIHDEKDVTDRAPVAVAGKKVKKRIELVTVLPGVDALKGSFRDLYLCLALR